MKQLKNWKNWIQNHDPPHIHHQPRIARSRSTNPKQANQESGTTMKATDILPAYLEACAWAESGEEESPLGEQAPDFHNDAEAYALERCGSFLHENTDVDGLDPEQVGHDLWLTSQGHGAGFWDRGYEYERGQRLTKRARLECADVYVGDDGYAHFNGERVTP